MDNLNISLKAARINAGFKQKDAANELGISASTLRNYENGKTMPDWTMVKMFEKLYNCPADYIFFGNKYA